MIGCASIGVAEMIDPATVAFFIPPELKRFKLDLFNRIGSHIQNRGGRVIRDDHMALWTLPPEVIPIVGCSPQLRPMIDEWIKIKREWAYWDRGYFHRVFSTWLPRGTNGGMYRWHRNSYQMQAIREVASDRFEAKKPPITGWHKNGKHIVIAAPTATYSRFHALSDWTDFTVDALARVTSRQLIIRGKESKRPLQYDLEGAHALISHGSIAAVESVICGCPVFVDKSSAAALVGKTDLAEIEQPTYPDRTTWLHSLAYSHYSEAELVDGTLWRLIE